MTFVNSRGVIGKLITTSVARTRPVRDISQPAHGIASVESSQRYSRHVDFISQQETESSFVPTLSDDLPDN